MKIERPEHIEQYYQSQKVADDYIRKRFTDPLNRVEHKSQVQVLNKIIHERGVVSVLEFAPGPARVTVELEIERGTSVDSSGPMLEIARERMRQRGKKWRFVRANILTLKPLKQVDIVFTFRFLLHFHHEKRVQIYQQAKKFLNPHGYLVFEAMNARVVRPLRFFLGRHRYRVYDKLYSKKELIRELNKNGFKVIKLYPVLSHFWLQALLSRPTKNESIVRFFERFPSSHPYEWIVLCRKK